jgi:hypothetical protein
MYGRRGEGCKAVNRFKTLADRKTGGAALMLHV